MGPAGQGEVGGFNPMSCPTAKVDSPETRESRQGLSNSKMARSSLPKAGAGPWVPEDGACYFWGLVGRRIKIGATVRLSSRLRELRYQNQLPCVPYLAVTTGGSRQEREYHDRFRAFHINGDWFSPAPEILAEIARLTTPDAVD